MSRKVSPPKIYFTIPEEKGNTVYSVHSKSIKTLIVLAEVVQEGKYVANIPEEEFIEVVEELSETCRKLKSRYISVENTVINDCLYFTWKAGQGRDIQLRIRLSSSN